MSVAVKEISLINVNISDEIMAGVETDRADEAFFNTTASIMRELAGQVPLSLSTVIVETPRGGSFSAATVALMEQFADAELAVANTGTKRNVDQPLLPEDFPVAEHYVIPDGIMATGNTMKEIIKVISNRCAKEGVYPSFSLLCPIVSAIGLEQDHNIFTWAEESGIKMTVYTGKVESKGAYVDFSQGAPKIVSADTPGAVLVVGQINHDEKGNITGIGIGDFGDMYSQVKKDDESKDSIVDLTLYQALLN